MLPLKAYYTEGQRSKRCLCTFHFQRPFFLPSSTFFHIYLFRLWHSFRIFIRSDSFLCVKLDYLLVITFQYKNTLVVAKIYFFYFLACEYWSTILIDNKLISRICDRLSIWRISSSFLFLFFLLSSLHLDKLYIPFLLTVYLQY